MLDGGKLADWFAPYAVHIYIAAPRSSRPPFASRAAGSVFARSKIAAGLPCVVIALRQGRTVSLSLP